MKLNLIYRCIFMSTTQLAMPDVAVTQFSYVYWFRLTFLFRSLLAEREEVELDTLSESVKSIRSLIKSRIGALQGSVGTKARSILNDPEVISDLSHLHNKYVIVPADKASNNIVFICKAYYYDCLINELGINNSQGNSTYKHTTLSKEEILDNHKSVLCSFGITTTDKDLDLSML